MLGESVPARADEAFANALKTMRVRTADDSGKEFGASPGTAMLGHPLNAVLWRAAEPREEGITLTLGDLLSLGASGARPAQARRMVTVTHEGLPGNPTASEKLR